MEIFDDRACTVGEGPAYDDRTGCAYWADVRGHRVLCRHADSGDSDEIAVSADGWSATEDRMCYVDTATRRVDVFDHDLSAGTATGRRPFVDVAPNRPDGMCTDAEGAASCAFAGADFGLLFITTAAVRTAVGTPEAGLTYAHRPGDVVGRPVHRFAG